MRDTGLPFSFRRIARNTAFLFAGRLLAGAGFLVMMSLVARILGVTDYGKFIFAFTYASIFSTLSTFGIDTVLVREVARRPSAAGELVSSAMAVKFVFSLVFILLALAALLCAEPREGTHRLVAIFLVGVLFNSLRTPRIVFEVHLESQRAVAVDVASKGIALLGVLVSMLLDFNAQQVALTVVLSEIPSLFLLHRLARKHYSFTFRITRTVVQFLLRETWQLALMSFLITVYFRIDTLMLSFIQGDTAVGFYNAAYLILTSLMLVPDAYVRSIFPVMSNAHVNDPVMFKNTFLSSLKYLATLGLWVAIVGWLYSGEIISLLFGAGYRPAADALRVLCIAAGVLFVSPLVSCSLTAMNRQKVNLYLCALNLVSNIVLNLLLIPRWSFVGAAAATVVAESAGCALALLVNLRLLGIAGTRAAFIRNAKILGPAACAVTLFLLIDGIHFIAAAALVSLAYALGLVLVRWFDADDISRIKRLMKGWK